MFWHFFRLVGSQMYTVGVLTSINKRCLLGAERGLLLLELQHLAVNERTLAKYRKEHTQQY